MEPSALVVLQEQTSAKETRRPSKETPAGLCFSSRNVAFTRGELVGKTDDRISIVSIGSEAPIDE